MAKNYYPLLEEFIEKLRSGTLNEAASAEAIAQLQRLAPKLEEQEAAISPYTGNTINVKKVAEEIEKAKYKITTQSQLYRPYVNDMSPTIYTWVIDTMATDGVRLFVNPEFAANLSWLGKIFVLIHEIMHCIMMHDTRGQGFDHDLFNQAADYEINAIICDTTDDFDEKFVKDDIHGLYEKKYLNVPVEEIYQDLLKNPPKLPPPPPNVGQGNPQFGGKPQPGQGQPQQGQGQGQGQGQQSQQGKGQGQGQGQQGQSGQQPGQGGGGGQQQQQGKKQPGQGGGEDPNAGQKKQIQKKLAKGDGGRCGQIIDKKTGENIAKAEGYSSEDAREGEDPRAKWQANAKEMMKTYEKIKEAGQGRGDSLIKALGKLLKPVVQWKSLLRVYVGSALSPEKEWRVGAKKHLYKSDEYLKRGLRTKKDAIKKAFLIVDASGSMFSKSGNVTIFDRVISEITHIIQSKKIKEIYVLFFDGSVDPNATQIIRKGQKVFKPDLSRASLGGGTNFQAPLDYIHDKYHDAVNLVIFLTDGYADHPKKPKYTNKFIWLVYDNPGWKKPFGRSIQVDMQDMV